jgi:uncharacterized protein YjbJ (UPF0337 family)
MMVNQQTLQGSWNEVKGKLRNKWGQLTNDDVQSFNGNVDQLIGLIQRKTGETRSAIEDFLDEVTAEGASALGRVTEEARRYSHEAADMIHEGSARAVEAVRHGYEDAETMVRRRPAESIAVGFGAGVLVGLLMGLVMQRR